MSNRRIALGLGTGAGALLGAALLSGLTSPIAAADDTFGFATIPPADLSALGVTSNPGETLPAFGGLGTDTISYEYLANEDQTLSTATVPDFITDQTNPDFGTETVLTNTYSNPIFTDTSTDVTAATGALDTANPLGDTVGTQTDTILLDPSSGLDFGISLESVPSTTAGDAPTVTEDLITPLGNFPISDLLGGSDLSSLFSGGDLSSLFTGGDLLTGLDPFVSLLTSF